MSCVSSVRVKSTEVSHAFVACLLLLESPRVQSPEYCSRFMWTRGASYPWGAPHFQEWAGEKSEISPALELGWQNYVAKCPGPLTLSLGRMPEPMGQSVESIWPQGGLQFIASAIYWEAENLESYSRRKDHWEANGFAYMHAWPKNVF
jgi:hypothetical protein